MNNPNLRVVSSPGRIDVSATELDLATLLALVEMRAKAEADGHLTLMRFTTGWKCMLGTPQLDLFDGYQEVQKLSSCAGAADALLSCLVAHERRR